jgi:hypothetical protein
MTTTSTAPQTKPPNSLNLPRNAAATRCPNTLPKWPLVKAMILHSPATQSSDYLMIMVSTSYKQGSADSVDEPKIHPPSSVPLILPPPRATVASPYHQPYPAIITTTAQDLRLLNCKSASSGVSTATNPTAILFFSPLQNLIFMALCE